MSDFWLKFGQTETFKDNFPENVGASPTIFKRLRFVPLVANMTKLVSDCDMGGVGRVSLSEEVKRTWLRF